MWIILNIGVIRVPEMIWVIAKLLRFADHGELFTSSRSHAPYPPRSHAPHGNAYDVSNLQGTQMMNNKPCMHSHAERGNEEVQRSLKVTFGSLNINKLRKRAFL